MDQDDFLRARISDIQLLAPCFLNQVREMLICLSDDHIARKTLYWRPFETYRTAYRQNQLKAEGRSKVEGGASPHQYGLAIDVVPYDHKEGWYWPDISDPCWRYLRETAKEVGLDAPISWDGSHIEHPLWRTKYWDLSKREALTV